MKQKRFFCLLLSVISVFTLLPAGAFAAGDSGLAVTSDQAYAYSGGVLTLSAPGNYMIAMKDKDTASPTPDRIVVSGGTVVSPVNVTLDSVNIDCATSGNAAFLLTSGAVVNITLAGDSFLTSANRRAGLESPGGTALTITTDPAVPGSLTAIGGNGGAGVGGGENNGYGTITILGGKIDATGLGSASGIGRG